MADAAHPLRRWRKSEGVTLAALAQEVDVTPSHLSEIERYENNPSIDLADRLSRATSRLGKNGIAVPLDAFVKAEAAE